MLFGTGSLQPGPGAGGRWGDGICRFQGGGSTHQRPGHSWHPLHIFQLTTHSSGSCCCLLLGYPRVCAKLATYFHTAWTFWLPHYRFPNRWWACCPFSQHRTSRWASLTPLFIFQSLPLACQSSCAGTGGPQFTYCSLSSLLPTAHRAAWGSREVATWKVSYLDMSLSS